MSETYPDAPCHEPGQSLIGAPPQLADEPPVVFQSQWNEKYVELLDSAKIAIVDDEELNIEVVQGYLEQEGYQQFFRTTDARQAIPLIEQVNPDVVLLDVMMPHISGLEILSIMRADSHMCHIPVIVLTACTGPDTKLQALKLGPSDFLSKPVDASELLLRLRNVLAVKAYQDHLANYGHELEAQVRKRTRQLAESRQRILHCLARAGEFRDNDTGHHVTRVGKYAAIIGRGLGLDAQRIDLLEQAAPLHDIGKIGIPDAVLLKEGKLEPSEFDIIKQHCAIGKSIIDPTSPHHLQPDFAAAEMSTDSSTFDEFPVMELAAMIAQTHHEKWDGSGYPRGLAGEAIPIEGRIVAVADVFDALSSKRPYKQALPRKMCFQILEEGRGTHFDPRVLDAFFASIEEIIEVQIQYADDVS